MKLTYLKQQIAHAIKHKLKGTPRSTKENNVWYEIDGVKVLRITYPHGKGTLSPGTLNSIKNQLKLNREQFIDLIECPMKAKDYEDIIRSLSIIE